MSVRTSSNIDAAAWAMVSALSSSSEREREGDRGREGGGESGIERVREREGGRVRDGERERGPEREGENERERVRALSAQLTQLAAHNVHV